MLRLSHYRRSSYKGIEERHRKASSPSRGGRDCGDHDPGQAGCGSGVASSRRPTLALARRSDGDRGVALRRFGIASRSRPAGRRHDRGSRPDPVSARRAARGLLDTTVFIARESGRPLRAEALPERAAISIVTRAELRAGVLAAEDISIRDRRLATLEAVARIAVLPIGDGVDRAWAQMRVYLAASGKRVNANDIWIAATAAAHGMPVVTQDADFDALAGVAGLDVIAV